MEGDSVHLTADRALAHCDESTIRVVPILGSTFDGARAVAVADLGLAGLSR